MSFQSNDFHGGSSAVKIISDTATLFHHLARALDTIAGMVYIGPDMDDQDTFFLTPYSHELLFKMCSAGRISGLSIHYLTRWNPSTHSRDRVVPVFILPIHLLALYIGYCTNKL